MIGLTYCSENPPTTNRVQPIELSALDRIITDSSFRGLVVAMASWCPPCREEMPILAKLYDKYREEGVQIIAISLDTDGPEAVQPLINMLEDSEREVGKAAAEALGDVGVLAVGLLIAEFEDEDSRVRWVAAKVLGQIGDERAVQPLVNALKDEEMRWLAVEALEAIGWEPTRDESGAIYYATKKEWDKCVVIGAPAVQPLVNALKALTRLNETHPNLRLTSSSSQKNTGSRNLLVTNGDDFSSSTSTAFRILQRLITGVGVRKANTAISPPVSQQQQQQQQQKSAGKRYFVYERDINMVLNAFSRLTD